LPSGANKQQFLGVGEKAKISPGLVGREIIAVLDIDWIFRFDFSLDIAQAM